MMSDLIERLRGWATIPDALAAADALEAAEQRIEELNREISRYQATTIQQSERIAELSNDLKSYAAMHIEQESEIGRLDAALEKIQNASYIGDGSTAILEDGRTYSCQQYAEQARAGECTKKA